MAIQKYLSLNGRLRGSYVTRSQKTWFLTDALGSVTATLNNSGSVVSTYRYKPYGATLATTGVGGALRFGWAGDTGSRYSARNYAEQYNWHRHYGHFQGQWTSRDILWPGELAFGYVNGNPINDMDPSGMCCLILTNEYHRGSYGCLIKPGRPQTTGNWAINITKNYHDNIAKVCGCMKGFDPCGGNNGVGRLDISYKARYYSSGGGYTKVTTDTALIGCIEPGGLTADIGHLLIAYLGVGKGGLNSLYREILKQLLDALLEHIMPGAPPMFEDEYRPPLTIKECKGKPLQFTLNSSYAFRCVQCEGEEPSVDTRKHPPCWPDGYPNSTIPGPGGGRII